MVEGVRGWGSAYEGCDRGNHKAKDDKEASEHADQKVDLVEHGRIAHIDCHELC